MCVSCLSLTPFFAWPAIVPGFCARKNNSGSCALAEAEKTKITGPDIYTREREREREREKLQKLNLTHKEILCVMRRGWKKLHLAKTLSCKVQCTGYRVDESLEDKCYILQFVKGQVVSLYNLPVRTKPFASASFSSRLFNWTKCESGKWHWQVYISPLICTFQSWKALGVKIWRKRNLFKLNRPKSQCHFVPGNLILKFAGHKWTLEKLSILLTLVVV